MTFYELRVYQDGVWVLVTKIDSFSNFGSVMDTIHRLGKNRMNLRLFEIHDTEQHNLHFAHSIFLADSAKIDKKDKIGKSYLFPSHRQIQERAYQIWHETGCQDPDKNYYKALEELTAK